jgi:hypothetical protein
MTTPPYRDLRTRMHHVAEEVTPLPVADDLWRRGQAARHRGQALVVAAVLMVLASVGGGVALWSPSDREARTASAEVPEGGAIPSRIEDPGDLGPTTDLAVGQVSVAFVSSSKQPVVVTAADGRYHALDLPGWDGGLLSLSPDGDSLAWTIESDGEGRPREGFALVDLASGELRLMSSGSPGSTTPQEISWSPSGTWLTSFADDAVSRVPVDPAGVFTQETTATGKEVEWSAVDDEGNLSFWAQGPRQWSRDGTYGRKKMSDGTPFDAGRRGRNHAATVSPDGQTVALASSARVPAVDFLIGDRFEERPLDGDLYPDGAQVSPLGWTQDSLLLARVDGPSGSYVEGPHLALMTSPDRPESEWTYRIVMRDVPDVASLSVAVDLVPDLDGTSSQELTHDFGDTVDDPPAPLGIELSLSIGLAVAGAIGLLLGLRLLWRRLA